eukprot:3022447-Prymnesium_polylepis.1
MRVVCVRPRPKISYWTPYSSSAVVRSRCHPGFARPRQQKSMNAKARVGHGGVVSESDPGFRA